MKNLYKIILGIVATGTVATAGVITANKIMENKEEETMTKEIQSISVENQNENNTEAENIINNSVEIKVEESNNNEIVKPSTSTSANTQITTKQPVISTQPVETTKVEKEKQIVCTINIIEYAKRQEWVEGIAQIVELRLNGTTVYKNTNIIDFDNNITTTIKGKRKRSFSINT